MVLGAESVILLLKRLWLQINTKRKKQIGLVMVLMLMASVAEIVSIGAVIPFLGILSNPELVFEHERLQFFINYFGITNSSQLLFPFTMIFCISFRSIRPMPFFKTSTFIPRVNNQAAITKTSIIIYNSIKF